jgi:hypothetical protein
MFPECSNELVLQGPDSISLSSQALRQCLGAPLPAPSSDSFIDDALAPPKPVKPSLKERLLKQSAQRDGRKRDKWDADSLAVPPPAYSPSACLERGPDIHGRPASVGLRHWDSSCIGIGITLHTDATRRLQLSFTYRLHSFIAHVCLSRPSFSVVYSFPHLEHHNPRPMPLLFAQMTRTLQCSNA